MISRRSAGLSAGGYHMRLTLMCGIGGDPVCRLNQLCLFCLGSVLNTTSADEVNAEGFLLSKLRTFCLHRWNVLCWFV